MLFNNDKPPFGSDENPFGSSQGSSYPGTNRLKPDCGPADKNTQNKLDLNHLVKFWNFSDENDEQLSLSLENNFTFKSSEQWDVLADTLNQHEMFNHSEQDPGEQTHDLESQEENWIEQPESRIELIQRLLNQSIVARENGELAKSRCYLQQSLREFLEFSHSKEQDDQGVQSLMGMIFIEMANQALESEELLSAYQFSCHAIKIAHDNQNDELYANALATLGVIVGLDGQLDLSFQLLSEAADKHRELEDHEGYIIDLMNLGELVSRDGMWDTSANLLDQAIQLSRQHECVDLFLKASEIRNQVESIIRIKETDPQRN